MAWRALNKLDKISKSKLKGKLKIQFFRSTVKNVLLYWAESWTLKNKTCRRLDGTYTRMLRADLSFTWRDRIKNIELYGKLSKITAVLEARRLRFIGHILKSTGMSITDVGTKTGNKEKRKVSIYICGPVEE